MKLRVLMGLLTGAMVGCGPVDDEPVSTNPDDSVVAIVSPNNTTWMCSATVIAPRAILSAGHCFLRGNTDKTGWTFEVAIAKDAFAMVPGERRIAITRVHLLPDYENQTP